jgi:hypothetical protein
VKSCEPSTNERANAKPETVGLPRTADPHFN